MLRSLQTSRLTRPARVRLSTPRRYFTPKSNGEQDGFAPSSLMKKLEAEDSQHAAELEKEYRKQGIDVRGMSSLTKWLTDSPETVWEIAESDESSFIWAVMERLNQGE